MSHLRASSAAGTDTVTESFTGRKKVTLAPGHSLMDWIRLGRQHGDLSGVGNNKKPVSGAELAMHNTQKDIWMAIRGKVYNLTPYMDYHPGGTDELMRAAGKDGTELFDEIHNWVNVDSMLEKCLVGPLVPGQPFITKVPINIQRPRQMSLGNAPVLKPLIPAPTHDWFQTQTDVVVVIYTKWSEMTPELVIVDILKGEFQMQAFIKDHSFYLHMKPEAPLCEVTSVTVSTNGKLEVKMKKTTPNVSWKSLGQPLNLHETYPRTKQFDCKYRPWTLTSTNTVTHDTKLLCFKAPPGCYMVPPVGYHVHIKNVVLGMEIARSYTIITPSLKHPDSDPEVAKGRALYLMVKSYTGGVVSPWLCGLTPGDVVQQSSFDGNFDLKRLTDTTHLVMFAAGTGFTSMIRLITHSLFNMKNATFPIKLVFFNKTQRDILWRDQLTELEREHNRFSVTHILSQETEATWKGLRGRVNYSHVDRFVPCPSSTPHPLFCICGQWAYNDVVESFARLKGLTDEHIHVFTQVS